jgi:hypothetical protein
VLFYVIYKFIRAHALFLSTSTTLNAWCGAVERVRVYEGRKEERKRMRERKSVNERMSIRREDCEEEGLKFNPTNQPNAKS